MKLSQIAVTVYESEKQEGRNQVFFFIQVMIVKVVI
jgi:hypothetical protein